MATQASRESHSKPTSRGPGGKRSGAGTRTRRRRRRRRRAAQSRQRQRRRSLSPALWSDYGSKRFRGPRCVPIRVRNGWNGRGQNLPLQCQSMCADAAHIDRSQIGQLGSIATLCTNDAKLSIVAVSLLAQIAKKQSILHLESKSST